MPGASSIPMGHEFRGETKTPRTLFCVVRGYAMWYNICTIVQPALQLCYDFRIAFMTTVVGKFCNVVMPRL